MAGHVPTLATGNKCPNCRGIMLNRGVERIGFSYIKKWLCLKCGFRSKM